MNGFNAFDQRFKRRADIGVKHAPFFGRDDMATALREQLDAERILDELNLMADRRVSQAQLVGGITDTLTARRSLKPFQRLERRQLPEVDFGLARHTSPLPRICCMPSSGWRNR